jgi:hypothetical protein
MNCTISRNNRPSEEDADGEQQRRLRKRQERYDMGEKTILAGFQRLEAAGLRG